MTGQPDHRRGGWRVGLWNRWPRRRSRARGASIKPSIRDNPEFNPEWDVYRNEQGEPVTITEEQLDAIWHAITVVERVRSAEHCDSLWVNARANLRKSRLLGRMLVYGKPPTRTKPPMELGAPWWDLLPGGDPFADPLDHRETA